MAPAVPNPSAVQSSKAAPVVARDEPLLLLLRREPGDDVVLPLHPGNNGNAAGCGTRSSSPWLLPTAGFAYLMFSSGMALHRSWPDYGAVAFIVFAYADLVALFYCLRRYERSEPGSVTRDRLKAVVWALTAALTLLFSYKVAALMPTAVAVLVWIMGVATIAGGFAAFFCFDNKKDVDTV
ncbi:hypothetical protein U9M48_002967 [Paspalum notatum var. saurae]|uniref:Uncharacterized protein n=1 Tax=Paspalum notatum var. saurae TaxID=547442 RepID=A0AAQ3PM10_PASNO